MISDKLRPIIDESDDKLARLEEAMNQSQLANREVSLDVPNIIVERETVEVRYEMDAQINELTNRINDNAGSIHGIQQHMQKIDADLEQVKKAQRTLEGDVKRVGDLEKQLERQIDELRDAIANRRPDYKHSADDNFEEIQANKSVLDQIRRNLQALERVRGLLPTCEFPSAWAFRL